jgi:uncharacterized membrane protein YedE/YeeE
MAVTTNAVAFVVGVTFALGLGIGGMTQPARVLAFLDVAGGWDPTLAFVMLGAVAVYAAAFPIVMRRGRPILGGAFALPSRRDVDGRLVGGARVFGIGWGLAGLCPGPGLTALASGEPRALLFVAAMTTGIFVHRLIERASAAPAAPRASTATAGAPARSPHGA